MENKFAIAIKCVVYHKKKILLLVKTDEERKDDAVDSSWDLPGGRIQYGESAEDAVYREIYEETSLKVNTLVLKSTNTVIRPDGLHLLILLFKCVCDSNKVMISNEHSAFHWLEIEEIKEQKSIPDWIKDSINVVEES
ncbi:MAG: NUDIX domain-containing protein [Ruminococcus sp.]|jgi:ADP-ribose pyrophosphatase YjhB (NUDIX family)|nr:NUDIX domain-containing protein [Ruminococcus sp.]